jgi:hypothetical protein
MEGGTNGSGINEQLGNGVDRDAGNSRDRAKGRTLDQHGEDLDALLYGQFVHAQHDMNFHA